MAYDLGVTARQRHNRPAYSAVGGAVTIGNDYYFHTFVTTGSFTSTSAIPIPIEIVDVNNNVVQSTTVPPFGTFNVTTTSSSLTYAVHSFNSSGVFEATSNLNNVSALLVAGGGGGGYGRTGNHVGGGGGAGGVRFYENLEISAGAKTITVGGGGAAWTTGSNTLITGFPGSIINPTGGGFGGGGGGANGFPGGIGPTEGGNGGSGGGSSGGYGLIGGVGILGEGFNGANGAGGGAGGLPTPNSGGVGGTGGIGRLININNTSTYYGGGGGGAGVTQGQGGLGGGGRGGKDNGTAAAADLATSGTPNTGGGGGAGAPSNSIVGGSGGSGIVIIKYPSALGIATGGIVTFTIEPGLLIRYPAPPSNRPDPNFKNTTLLLSSEKETTFVEDASTYSNSISILGDTKPYNFNPYSENYSLNFNGSTNFLRVASTSTAAFGSDNFTIEAWIYVTGSTGTYRTIYSTRPTSATAGVYTGGSFGVNPTGGLYWQTGELVANNASDLLLTNRWNHVAVVKHDGAVNIFLNGSVVPNTDASGVNAVLLDYLVVAGGGGGGSTGGDGISGQGGGGAGGLLTSQINANFGITYPVIVGAGAAVGASNGSTSSFSTVVATGGGRGGAFKQAGFPGGSGGGAGGRLDFLGGTGIAGQGNNGGRSNTGDTAGTGSGGGGGGAGAAGSNGVTNFGGRGGDGIISSISGTARYYAGGGGGMTFGTGGAGGLGGGGAGRSSGGPGDLGAGGNATPNTGGGGGGGPGNGPGLGGSGVVILRHPDTQPQATVTGGVTVTTTGSNIVYTFTASGTISFVATSAPPPVNELSLTTATIGANLNGSEPFSGYISNLRVVKGQDLYTEEFTVGAQPLTTATVGHRSIDSAITGTVALLTAASNKFVDKSPANLSFTTGTAAVSNLQPFTYPYSFNGSAYFDGAGDFLTAPSGSIFNFGTADFTIESWIYLTSYSPGYTGVYTTAIVSRDQNAALTGRNWWFNISGTASTWSTISFTLVSGSTLYAKSDSYTFSLNTWYHVAAVRRSGTAFMYVNGISIGSGAPMNAANNTNTLPLYIGQQGFSTLEYYFPGYISDLRIVKGTAVYAENFTPPTEPLTAIPNTVLLTLQNNVPANNRAFRDTSNSNAIVTPFGSVTQGTFGPHGTGWSGYFDGTGDYLTIPFRSSFVFTGNFTIEGWINPVTLPALNSQKYIIASWNAGSNLRSFYVILQNVAGVNQLSLGLSSDGTSGNAASVSLNWTPAISAWSHFAIVRNGSTVTMYANGASLGTGTLSTVNFGNGSAISIGADSPALTAAFYWNGYITNLRVIKGNALYTSNFTLPVSDLPRISNTSLLTLQGNRFVDNSENNFTITRFGDTRIERFSPYRTPGYNSLINSASMYFNGSTDYLEIPHNANQLIGTSDFTIEAWVYLNNYASANGVLSKGDATSGTAGVGSFFFGTTGSSGTLGFDISNNFVITGGVVPLNSWNHIAVTRSSGTMYLWLNGVLTASAPIATSINYAAVMRVGRGRGGSTNYFAGYMSDVRLIVGTALYAGPEYTPLTAIDNTVLLTAQSSSLIDNSTYGNIIGGTAFISTSTPFANNIGGDGYFSYSFINTAPTKQVISVANTSTLNFGSSDFTIETWIYPTDVSGEKVIASLYGYSNDRRAWYLAVRSGEILFRVGTGSGASILYSNTAILPNTWYFISAIKQGTTARIYINGRLDATDVGVAGTIYNNTVDPIYIGAVGPNLTGYYQGLISNLRILKGTARIPNEFASSGASNFTVPQTPAKAVPNTVLLLDGTNSAIVDRTGRNNVITVGDVRLQKSRYISGAVTFDGTGDYLNIPYNAAQGLSNGNFTIEAWIYPTTTGVVRGIANNWQTGGQFLYDLTAANTLQFIFTNAASGVSNTTYTGTTPIAANTWTHVAVVRNGTSLTHYINGVIDAGGSLNIGTQTLFYYNGEAKNLRIGIGGDLGSPFAGIISDFRIVKGTAVYTANFTRPTARLTAITNTLLLTCQQDLIRDYSNNNFSVSALGDARVTPDTQFGVLPPIITTPYATNTVLNSMAFDGTGDYISIPLNPALQFGTGDFTVEFWSFFIARGVSGSGLVTNYTTFQAGSLGIFAGHGSANITKYQVSYNGTGFPNIQSTTSILYNQWAHIAVVRYGTTITLYINGTANGTITSASAALNGTGSWSVGTAGDAVASYYTNGYIQDLRITKGVARYTANFTAPIAPPPTR